MLASHFPVDRSIELLEQSIGQVLIAAAADSPNTIALMDGQAKAEDRRRWTYPELLAAALGAAHGLLARFQPGERLAVWAPSMPEWEIVRFGAALAGVTVVTVNPAFTANELAHLLGDRPHDLATAHGPVTPHDRCSRRPSAGGPARCGHDPMHVQHHRIPEGAMLSHRGMVNNAVLFGRRFQLAAGSIWVNPLPMFHVGGYAFAALGALCRRATHVLFAFDPRSRSS